jgi:hypothetical protein
MKLRQHFHALLDLWNQFRDLNPTNIIPQITKNLGNLNSVLWDAFQTECPDALRNFQDILFLNHFYGRILETYYPIMLILSAHISHWQNHSIFGDYLIECLESCAYLPLSDAETQITLGREYFSNRSPLEQGVPICLICVGFKTQSGQPSGT